MQANKKTNLMLFAILLLIATLSYLVKHSKTKTDAIFLPIKVNSIEHFLIQQTPEIELTKRNDAWHMLQPQTGQVNQALMQSVLAILTAAVYEEYDIADVSLKELSLAPPNLRVLIDGEALEFGALSPISQKHYVRYKDKVYLASPFVKIRFSYAPEEFLKPDIETEENVDETTQDPIHGDAH